jgi:hypothetical protein
MWVHAFIVIKFLSEWANILEVMTCTVGTVKDLRKITKRLSNPLQGQALTTNHKHRKRFHSELVQVDIVLLSMF